MCERLCIPLHFINHSVFKTIKRECNQIKGSNRYSIFGYVAVWSAEQFIQNFAYSKLETAS